MATEHIRATVKQALKGSGPLFRTAKSVYEVYKQRQDARRVRAAYPGTEIVSYTPQQVAGFRAAGYRAQFGQDHYLLEQVFAGRPPGRFVEIGANDPLHNNNSYAFEQAGWTGWAFEPLDRFAPDWAQARKTPFIQVALSDTAGTRSFVEFESRQGWEHQLSGFAESVRPEDLKLHPHRIYDITCQPLTELLPEVTELDLALIDVEGAELPVIAGLGLDRIRIDWILVENVLRIGGDERVRAALAEHGYAFRARIAATDDLYQRTG